MAKKSSKGKSSSGTAKRAGGAEAAIEVQGQHATLLIEVQPTPRVIKAEGFQGGQTANAAEDAISKLKEVGGAIADVCEAIYVQVEEALEEAIPDELTLQFGLKLSGKAGIPLLTKVSAEGSLVVTAKWVLKKGSGNKTENEGQSESEGEGEGEGEDETEGEGEDN